MALLLISTLTISFLYARDTNDELYVKEPIYGKKRYDDYLNSLGIEDLKLEQDCYPISLGVVMCNPFKIVNGHGNTVINGGFVASRFYKARYESHVFGVVVRENAVIGISQALLVDSEGNSYSIVVPEKLRKSTILFPLEDMNILYISNNHIATASRMGSIINYFNIPPSSSFHVVGYNTKGDVSVAFINGNDIVIHNLESEFVIYNAIKYYSDRKGILSVYPESKYVIYVAVYKYINPYAKGIYLYKIDMQSKMIKARGFVFLSSKRNIGFDVEVYKTIDGIIIISAKDSTNNKDVYFYLGNEDLEQLIKEKDIHIDFLFEKSFELHISTYTGLYYLIGNLSAPDIDGAEDISYKADATQFYGAFIAGRSGDYQIAVSYLKSKLKEELGNDEGTEILLGVVNINKFIKPYWTLRFGYERVKFVAKLEEVKYTSDDKVSLLYDTLYTNVIMERGTYIGGEYIKSSGPGLFTFSSPPLRKDLLIDSESTIESLLLIVGYDSLAYSKRYETNISKPYFSGEIGYGFGRVKLSDRLKDKAKTLGYGVDNDYIMLRVALKARAEVGFLIQRRWKSLKGGGLAFNVGYRLLYYYFSDSDPRYTIRNDQIEVGLSEGLYEKFEKQDTLHGPFLQLSVIF